MRIFVVSDTHGSLKNAIELYERACHAGPVDFIIHCGDYYRDGTRLAELFRQTVYAVHGNCDGGWSGPGGEFAVAQTPAGGIIVIHGHNEDVGFALDDAARLAKEEGCRMVCFGHTHKAVIKEVDGILFVNPGSALRPRDLNKPSAAIVTADEAGFRAGILYL